MTLQASKKPVLEPIDRMSEIIFGLLMALSFTGTMSASVAGGDEVRSVLAAALGCNIAWGIVDAVMYVLATVIERRRHFNFMAAVRSLPAPQAQAAIRENLPEEVRNVFSEEEAGSLLARLRDQRVQPNKQLFVFHDLKAALLIFALVVLSTLPPSLPFLFIENLHVAMRCSNAVALLMLFVIGAQLGRFSGGRPLPMALAMASVGSVLVAVTIALGG